MLPLTFLFTFLPLQSSAQTQVPRLGDEGPGNLFGFALASVGDVDGDRIQDFIVGDPRPKGIPFDGNEHPGRAWLVSTRTHRSILDLSAGEPGDEFGQLVAGPGDLNGDGVPDVLVGSTPPPGKWSVLRAFSGANGLLLHKIEFSELPETGFVGWSCIAGLGDVDSDKCDDYALASVNERGHDDSISEIRIISGKTGTTLFTLLPVKLGGSPFRSIVSAGDLDRDGYQDLLASRVSGDPRLEAWSVHKRERLLSVPLKDSAQQFPVAGRHDLDRDGTPDFVVAVVDPRGSAVETSPRIQAFSGKDASPIRTWKHRDVWNFGEMVDLVEDVNGDRVPDLLVRSPGSGSQVSRVWVLSGAEDRVIHEWTDGPATGSYFGVSGASIGDVDGDGIGDLLIGEASYKAGGDFPGFVRLFSGKTGTQRACWRQSDIRSGGR